jgi:DNA helicase HerA-like ATPase
MNEAFRATMAAGYSLDEPAIVVGSPMLDGETMADVRVRIPLAMLNRHGLVAGATGTGKTKTLQLLAGQLSKAGVPVFVVDIKGDLSGLGLAGDAANERIQQRCATLGWTYEPAGHPVEFLSLSGRLGAQVRATVSSFGPLLLGKVLDFNETQTSILSLVFKYCDDKDLPLLDLADLRTTLRYLASDEGKVVLDEYGGMSAASLGVILRSIVTIEQEGADVFFGEPEFDVLDLLRQTPTGEGVVSVMELPDVMDRPRLFSTFTLWLLAQLYEALPEVGDLPKPKLCFFFDEAHLLFRDASDALMEQVERTARLIRSKGVGVYFVTQAPTDVPSSVLSQLGNRVQHALRAFTPEDADNLRRTARTFPMTDYYDVERTLTSLGIGEALVTGMSPRGAPTPLAATLVLPPDSLMAPMPEERQREVIAGSLLATKYATTIDRESAHEMISARLAAAKAAADAVAGVAGGTAAGPSARRVPASTMTRAEQQREVRRQARELERQRRERERARKAADREARAAARQRERLLETSIRTAGKVVTSSTAQRTIRGIFDTFFGKSR